MRRSLLSAAALLFLLAGPSAAQTADDLFNPNALQRIEMWLNDADWEKLKANFRTNDYYPVDVTYNGKSVTNAGMRSRGLGSRLQNKPGLRVDMDYYNKDQTFLGLKSFILDNLSQDKSGVRETTATRMMTRLGIPASREAHTELYVNGKYAGLYAVVESVDKDFLARVFGSIGADIQNDGFLFEYNYVEGDAWRFEYLGPSLAKYKQYFSAKTHEGKSDATIWGPIEELVRLVNETPLDTFEQTIKDKLDLTQFTKYLAAQAFLGENDGFVGYAGQNNFYFYRLENSTQHVFIAWDDDNTFYGPDFPINARVEENVLARKTLSLSTYSALFYQTQLDLAAMASDGDWLKTEVDRQLAMISSAMTSDKVKPYTDSEFSSEKDFISGWAGSRAAFVRCEVARILGAPKPAGCP